MAGRRLFRGQRVCAECGSHCWADEDRNWEEATHLAEADALSNPGRDAWEKALEARGIELGSDLCGRCLVDLWGQAWSIRKREERLEEREPARLLRKQRADREQAGRVPTMSPLAAACKERSDG